MIIAIDGPAGSGKSTIAKQLAEKLNISYLDTGAMYRGLTLVALLANADFTNPNQLIQLAKDTRLSFGNINGENTLLINGKATLDDKYINEEIRSQKVTDSARPIASNPHIREILVCQQQAIGQSLKSLVTEGRDQTTVVFPKAELKFYLDAKPEIRAKRRYEQMLQKGMDVCYNEILKSQLERDHSDTSRTTGALKIADDAIVVDTSDMNIDEVINYLFEYINNHRE